MKRIVFIAGYYGSGKTEISINLAIKEKVNYLVDLDIINPYFRSREAKKFLASYTEIISSDLKDDTYTDLPFLSKKIFLPFHDESKTAIYDLGGTDLGAKVMKQFEFKQDFDFYFIINIFRMETNTVEKIKTLIQKIEESSGFKITGLINNSNLLNETTYKEILEGEDLVELVSDSLRIPVIYTCIHESIYDEHIEVSGDALIIKTHLRKDWY